MTSVQSIDRAEDREQFSEFLEKLGLRQPKNGIARNAGTIDAATHDQQIIRPVFGRNWAGQLASSSCGAARALHACLLPPASAALPSTLDHQP